MSPLGLSWPTVMGLLTGTFDLTTIPEQRLVKRRGVDEHRFRRVRYVRDDDGSVTRVEPWSITLTDLDTGAILDVVDGPRGTAVEQWLAARPRWWRRRIEFVAMDMSSEFHAAIRTALPKAKISADHWHVVRLTNARTEAANLNAKTFKRAGRGHRNRDNYRSRIMAYAPTTRVA